MTKFNKFYTQTRHINYISKFMHVSSLYAISITKM